MIKFKIKNRSTGKVQVAAEFECADDAPHSVKLGLAVQWAVRNKANLRGTDLHEADLHEANLHGAKSIVSFGPVGKERRIGYAVSHNDGPRIQLGCFWGTLDEACVAIAKKYGENSTYEQLARAACAVLDDSKGA